MTVEEEVAGFVVICHCLFTEIVTCCLDCAAVILLGPTLHNLMPEENLMKSGTFWPFKRSHGKRQICICIHQLLSLSASEVA